MNKVRRKIDVEKKGKERKSKKKKKVGEERLEKEISDVMCIVLRQSARVRLFPMQPETRLECPSV
jgi:hypothetical protein